MVKNGGTYESRRNVSRPGPKAEKLSFFCHDPGHLIVDCAAWRRKQQGAASRQQPKGVGLVKTVTPVGQVAAPRGPDECFKPFNLEGLVSLTGEAEDQRPVLHDTGGSQSFIPASAF
ncbi:hypothetical protein VZT92_022991 [Zoarces viviparus]|uniref:Uncharacterized protein n=1 Tax=Zoarces viviparus TaxID=48416 RepID=A0AAW1E5I1_ZOAVI